MIKYSWVKKMMECKLKQIHRVKHSVPIKINTQTHKYDELVYFISGCGTTMINGQTLSYKSGDFAFYKSGTPHNEYDPVPCDIIWMHFFFDIEGVALKEGLFCDIDGRLLSCLLNLRKQSLEQSDYRNQMVEIFLAEAILVAAQIQNTFEVAHSRTNWEKVLNYIDSNINEQIDFVFLAKSNGYSYDRFRHLFAEQFGLSPYAYLTNQRIEHAKRLLKNSNLNVTEIAYDSGFNSSSQFANIFKKHVGETPKGYKKRASAK